MKKYFWITLLFALCMSTPTYGMHIMEGYLPVDWSIFWTILSLPFMYFSYRSIRKTLKKSSKFQISLGLSAAFVFILSALKLPSVTGSCSHLTGTTLGTVLVGPISIPIIGFVVLLFQALLLAHGGISTLGANIFSLAIIGPFVAFYLYKLLLKIRLRGYIALFIATFVGTMATYITTSIQLGLAYPDPSGGFITAAIKFLSIFAVTQIPLSIVEGLITVWVFDILKKQGIPTLNIFKAKKAIL